jgi:hypothetical protein
MTIIKEASTACWYLNEAGKLIGRQPKYPIERGEPQDILGRSPSAANDNDWLGRLFHFRKICWCEQEQISKREART